MENPYAQTYPNYFGVQLENSREERVAPFLMDVRLNSKGTFERCLKDLGTLFYNLDKTWGRFESFLLICATFSQETH